MKGIIGFAAIVIFVFFIITPLLYCYGDSSKEMVYELQERCGKTAEQWAKQHSELVDYIAHYNNNLNKCIILATLTPIISDNHYTSYAMLYDVNAHKIIGQYTVYFYQNSEDHICIINGKNYGKDSREKWSSFVKEMMEE